MRKKVGKSCVFILSKSLISSVDVRIRSLAFKFDGVLNINKLQDLISDIIQNYGANLYRYKGVIAVKGFPE